MEIRGKDSIWKLRILFTCSMNAQNLLLFSNIHWSNGKLGWMWYYPLACRILKIHPVFEKNGKSPLKIGFSNLGSIPPEGRILRIYLSFLEFTKKICFFKICKFRHFFSYLTKTSEPHKKTVLVVVSSLFISDAFRL